MKILMKCMALIAMCLMGTFAFAEDVIVIYIRNNTPEVPFFATAYYNPSGEVAGFTEQTPDSLFYSKKKGEQGTLWTSYVNPCDLSVGVNATFSIQSGKLEEKRLSGSKNCIGSQFQGKHFSYQITSQPSTIGTGNYLIMMSGKVE
ncbi:hypothetical protein BH10PSE19_BH10PSE19_00610 [soil metagenome]